MSSDIHAIEKELTEDGLITITIDGQIKNAPEEVKQSAEYNSLFYFVMDHIEELINKGHDIKNILTNKNSVFQLKIKSVLTFNLYRSEGYACVARFLNIYEKCTRGDSPLSKDKYIVADYQEIYQNPQGNQIQIVLPFNRFGQHLSHQMLNLPVQGSDYRHDFMHNAREAKNILGELLQDKANTYFELRQSTHKLWSSLTTEYYHGDDAAYIERMKAFQEKAFDLKRYSDGVPLEYDITHIQARVDYLQAKDVDEKFAQSHRNKCCITIGYVRLLEWAFDQIVSQDTKSLNTRIQAFQCKQRLLRYLSDLTFFTPFKDIKEKDEDRLALDDALDRIDTKVKKCASLIDLLDACFQAGDIEAFKSLLPYQTQAVLKPSLFNSWHTKLVHKSQDSSILDKQIIICGILFEQSCDYRNFILTNHMVIALQDYRCSPLFLALLGAKFEVFSMLLAQGYAIDNEGVIYNDKLTPILHYALCCESRESFAQLLIDYEVVLDAPQKLCTLPEIQQEIPPTQEVCALVKRANTLTQRYPCDLLIAWQWDRYTLTPLIQDRTNTMQLAIILAHLILNTKNIKYSQAGRPARHGIVCQANLSETQKLEEQRCSHTRKTPPCRWLSILVYTDTSIDVDLNLKSAFHFITSLSATLHAKFLENRTQGLSASIDNLAKKADQLKDNANLARCFYLACILLLTEKSELTEQEMHQVMQYYCKMADIAFSLEQRMESKLCLMKAMKFVHFSAYAQKLQDTPEFRQATFVLGPLAASQPLVFTQIKAKKVQDPANIQAREEIKEMDPDLPAFCDMMMQAFGVQRLNIAPVSSQASKKKSKTVLRT